MSLNGWRAAPDGTWRKELGGLEKVYRFQSTICRAAGREHWGLYSICKLSSSESLSPDMTIALRNAWKALRIEYPALGLTLDGYEAIYSTCKEKEEDSHLEHWAQATFHVETKRTVEEILGQYPLNDLPTLYWLPRSSELMFLISHWRTDGIGSVMLLDKLLGLVVEPADNLPDHCGHADLELVKISPTLEDAAGAPHVPTSKILDTAGQISKLFREKAIKSVGLPYKGGLSTPPGNPAVEAVVFTTDSSKALFDACKARQITVSAAVHAALAEAVFDLAADYFTEYATVMAVNMRPYVQAPYNTPEHACRTYVTSITPSVQRDASFIDSAVSITRHFKNWYSTDLSDALREVYQGASRALLSPPSKLSGSPPPPPSGVLHSNIGIVDKLLRPGFGNGALQIDKYRFGVSMMTRQMLLYPWSFRGKFNLSINYNDAYYDASSPRQMLECIQEKLERGLGIKLEQCASDQIKEKDPHSS